MKTDGPIEIGVLMESLNDEYKARKIALEAMEEVYNMIPPNNITPADNTAILCILKTAIKRCQHPTH